MDIIKVQSQAKSEARDAYSRVVVVGDTPYDAEAATKAGLRIVGVLCGGWGADELRKAGCSAVYRDPADLLARYPEWLPG